MTAPHPIPSLPACGVWPTDAGPCGKPEAERLHFCNPLTGAIGSDGLAVCVDHLAEHITDHLLAPLPACGVRHFQRRSDVSGTSPLTDLSMHRDEHGRWFVAADYDKTAWPYKTRDECRVSDFLQDAQAAKRDYNRRKETS